MNVYLQFTDEDSAKFWRVTVTGTSVITGWGKIGTKGQSKTKTFESPALAEDNAIDQINAKLKKGHEKTTPPTPYLKIQPAINKEPPNTVSIGPKNSDQKWSLSSLEVRLTVAVIRNSNDAIGIFTEVDRAIAGRGGLPVQRFGITRPQQ